MRIIIFTRNWLFSLISFNYYPLLYYIHPLFFVLLIFVKIIYHKSCKSRKKTVVTAPDSLFFPPQYVFITYLLYQT